MAINVEDFVKNHNLEQQSYVDEANKNAIARYVGAVANYNLFEDEVGKVPWWPEPTVPEAAGLSAPDDQGLQEFVMTGLPVCDPLPIHSVIHVTPVPNTCLIGIRLPGTTRWFQAGQLDTEPNGFLALGKTSADNVTGDFQKFGNPITSNGAVHGVYLLLDTRRGGS